MWDDNSIYPKIESGQVFIRHMNDIFNIDSNGKTFNQDGGDSADLKVEYYHPPNQICQHLPTKEKGKNIEVN